MSSPLADWSESPAWLAPVPTSDDREFWVGARNGELRIQRCGACGLHQHYARMLCSHCGADEIAFVVASGLGTIYSFTVIRKNGVPPFRERVPFVVASVQLDEPGARVLAAMPTTAIESVAIGARVRAQFRPVGDEFAFVDFALDSA